MVSDTTITESQLIALKAEEYRVQGYEVSQDVPIDFLPGFKADLVARKDGHTRVIGVATRTTLARRNVLKELGNVLNNKPGWSFELLLVGEPERLAAPQGSHSMTEEGISRRLEDTRAAANAGLDDAAFLLAWSAVEAVVRSLVAAEGVLIERVTAPDYLLDMAVYHGAISRDDYNCLSNLMTYRNALIHGFDVANFGDNLIKELLETVKRLMYEVPE